MQPLSRNDNDNGRLRDDAVALREMVRFAEEAESMSLERLLEALPILLRQSSEKLEIATRVMSKRLATFSDADRTIVIRRVEEIIRDADDELARRVRASLN